MPGTKIILRDIDAIDNSCSLCEHTSVSCSLYPRNDMGSGGHMQSGYASLAEACRLSMTRFNLPTAEAAGSFIEAALAICTRL